MKKNAVYLLLLPFVLAGCAEQSSRYALTHDKAPTHPVDVSHVKPIVPKYEPYSRGGNKDYSLFGNRYRIIKNPDSFKQIGTASWYGEKFHGHTTSNGETYDMYSLSAAHKTLPLPSYVKVKNLNNDKTLIVRVNDRGPFHDGRIIDLSYAAASKLGVLATGTAPVEIEVMTVDNPKTNQAEQPKPPYAATTFYVQIFASSNQSAAKALALRAGQRLTSPNRTETKNGLTRVYLGPFYSADKASYFLKKARRNGYPNAFVKN